MVCGQGLLRVGDLGLRPGERPPQWCQSIPLERCTGLPPPWFRISKAHAPDFDRLARMPCPAASLASAGPQPLELGPGALVLPERPGRVRQNTPANSAQALDGLMSTLRTAAIAGPRWLGTPNRRGGFPTFDAAPAASSENDHGSMNLETAPLPATMPSSVAHPPQQRVPEPMPERIRGRRNSVKRAARPSGRPDEAGPGGRSDRRRHAVRSHARAVAGIPRSARTRSSLYRRD